MPEVEKPKAESEAPEELLFEKPKAKEGGTLTEEDVEEIRRALAESQEKTAKRKAEVEHEIEELMSAKELEEAQRKMGITPPGSQG